MALTREQEDAILAETVAAGNATAVAVIRAAYRWGYRDGWAAGYDRSFHPWVRGGGHDAPSQEELEGLRAEIRPAVGDGQHQGGSVAPW